MVALRDGRKLIGVLRSWDQFANLVLQQTVERIFTTTPSPSSDGKLLYADIPRGIFLVRGENVLLLGEIDLDTEDDAPKGYEKADVETVHALAKEEKARRVQSERSRGKVLRGCGFEGEGGEDVMI